VSGDRDFIPIARQVLEENKELRMVAIPDATSGDLRMRVGGERFWNALDLIPAEIKAQKDNRDARLAALLTPAPPAGEAGWREDAMSPAPDVSADGNPPPAAEAAGADGSPLDAPPRTDRPFRGARVVGHIPVTWKQEDLPENELVGRLEQCLDLVVRAQIRHGSPEVWLSPFLKGPMSQHFSSLVHPERRALINELRSRGAIRVEERDNLYADHPYSVIVLDEQNPLAQAAIERVLRRRPDGTESARADAARPQAVPRPAEQT
jgi:hypothetical protein